MDNDCIFICYKIIIQFDSIAVVEVLSRTGERPFRRVIEEFDSTRDKYDDAMLQARAKLHNLRH